MADDISRTTVEPWDNETCPKCGYAPETTCTDGADCPYNEGQRATSRTTEVEAVAKAMHDDAMARNRDGDDYPSWAEAGELVREAWRHSARAAISAMKGKSHA